MLLHPKVLSCFCYHAQIWKLFTHSRFKFNEIIFEI